MIDERATSERAVTDGSGDIFSDLGIELTPEERLKVAIATTITQVINETGRTQSEVAGVLGTDQAKVSALTRGRLKGFSTQRLIGYLLELGFDVDVHISKHRDGEQGSLRVTGEPAKAVCN